MNILDNLISQVPDDVNLQEIENPYKIIVGKTEFNKIKHLLDKEQKYKGYKVCIFDEVQKK
jgi:hypothetical protein